MVVQVSRIRELSATGSENVDEKGIEIPFPHQTIYMGQDKAGKSPPLFVEQQRREIETA